MAGFNATHPTFVVGEVVVKFFGYSRGWRRSHSAERAAHALIATDPAIVAPRVLANGQLCDSADAAWPYLVTSRMSGVPWRDAELSAEQRLAVAADLGEQVRRVHALPTTGVATHEDWAAVDVTAGAERSSLPPHLVAQAADYVARLGPAEPVFLHADLVETHVFVEGGRLAGIIDWGDALVGDRHLELIQVYRGLFDCDRELFRVFLDASGWPVGEDFAQHALGCALHRQAIGLAQHNGMDVFEPIAEQFPLHEIRTLDDLATELFGR